MANLWVVCKYSKFCIFQLQIDGAKRACITPDIVKHVAKITARNLLPLLQEYIIMVPSLAGWKYHMIFPAKCFLAHILAFAVYFIEMCHTTLLTCGISAVSLASPLKKS